MYHIQTTTGYCFFLVWLFCAFESKVWKILEIEIVTLYDVWSHVSMQS